MPICMPSELVDFIIDQCQSDSATLQVCSLVNRDWLPRTRYHLFRRINIHPKNASAFLDLVEFPKTSSSFPFLINAVKASVYFYGGLFNSSFAHVQRAVNLVNGAGHVNSLSFVHGHAFIINSQSSLFSPNTTITELTLSTFTFQDLSALCVLLSSLPSLTSLKLEHIRFVASPSAISHDALATLPAIDSLELRDIENAYGGAPSMLPFMQSLRGSLKHLKLAGGLSEADLTGLINLESIDLDFRFKGASRNESAYQILSSPGLELPGLSRVSMILEHPLGDRQLLSELDKHLVGDDTLALKALNVKVVRGATPPAAMPSPEEIEENLRQAFPFATAQGILNV